MTDNADSGKYWTRSWTPCSGCSPYQDAANPCAHCWATGLTKLRPQATHGSGFAPTFHSELLSDPSRWRKPQIVFAGIMGDWCHDSFTDDQRTMCLEAMRSVPRHVFLTCTKRVDTLVRWANTVTDWPSNVWLGATTWNADSIRRTVSALDRLLVGAHLWTSMEPLLGDPWTYQSQLDRFEWICLGAETGTGRRQSEPSWFDSALRLTEEDRIPTWVKAFPKGDGITHKLDEMPAWARRREYPPALAQIAK